MRDRELVERLRSGDEDALEQIVRRYTPYVMTVIRAVAVPPLSEEDAEEIAADTFALLWTHADSIRQPDALRSYLAQTARNAARRRRKQHKTALPLEDDVVASSSKRPDATVSLYEQMQIVNETLQTMDAVRQACLIHRYYYDEPLQKVATQLQLPLSTVKSHVYRGRQQLIEALKERGYDDEDRF